MVFCFCSDGPGWGMVPIDSLRSPAKTVPKTWTNLVHGYDIR